jgi:hypothetical protein
MALIVAVTALFPAAEAEELRYGAEFPRPQGSCHGEFILGWQPYG